MADLTTIDPAAFYSLGQCVRITGFGRDVLAHRCDTGVLPCRRASGPGRGAWRKVKGSDLIAFLLASGVTDAGEVKTPPAKATAPPVPAPPAPPSAAVRRRAKAEHQRALEEIGCG